MECGEFIEEGSAVLLRLSGRMTFNDRATMKRVTKSLIAERKSRVVIDLSVLDYVDSAAIGMLLIIAETLRSTGGTMALENAQGQVARVLSVTKIYELIPNP